MNAPALKGVVLPEGHTGSSLFHLVLREATARFPDALSPARLPSAARDFKRSYREALVRFEAHRAASAQRVEIARFIVQRTLQALRHASEVGLRPLEEHLREAAPPVSLELRNLPAAPGLRAELSWDGKLYRGLELVGLSERLLAESVLTEAAAAALRWIAEHIEARGGRLDLRGERFAMLGAGAELAPTRLLLAAGASVLWVDVAPPEQVLGSELHELSGTLVQASGAGDLLQQPRAVLEAMRRFAGDGPLHLGLFAYASGASREWRLAATMNAIAAQLDPAQVRSIAMLISPTTAAPVQTETARVADERARRPIGWQNALRALGLLAPGGYHEIAGSRIACAAVSIQGLSYQAAQYISKLAAAETFAVHGTDFAALTPKPTTVSANVAGITRTRSLQHPLFQAAFVGAPRFGVRIFDAETTRTLNGLLTLHDLLNPEAPGAAGVQPRPSRLKAERLLSQQVHGGIYAMPYELESAIRIAALIGLGSRPSVLLPAKRRSAGVVPRPAPAAAGPGPELSAAE